MRTSGLITSSFQHSEIHKTLLNNDPEHLVLAYHLMICANSHMSGLYYYPVCFMASELMRTEDAIERPLENLEAISFLQYDYNNSYVWVINMAFDQGGFRSEKDSRRINCLKHIRNLPDIAIRDNFIEYYAIQAEFPTSNSNGGYTEDKRASDVPPTVYIPSHPIERDFKGEIPKTENPEIDDKFPEVTHAKEYIQ